MEVRCLRERGKARGVFLEVSTAFKFLANSSQINLYSNNGGNKTFRGLKKIDISTF